MFTLALETTAEPAGVALLSDDGVLEERRLREGTRRGVGLLPAVSDLLKAHLSRPSDVSLVAVSLGPGSFTGIRIGIAAARSFARFAGARIVGVPTIEALAEETPAGHERMAVAIDAGRGRVYGAIYTLKGGGPAVEMEPAVLPAEELAGRIRGPAFVVGNAPGRHPEAFRRDDLILAPPESYPPRPSTIGRLGIRTAAEAGGRADVLPEPIYLQPPRAKTKREREAERLEDRSQTPST